MESQNQKRLLQRGEKAMELSCSCDYDGDAEPVLMPTIKTRKANKDHTCTECGGAIIRGENYELFTGLCDGRWFTQKTCADCLVMIAEVGRTFFSACGGWKCRYMGFLPYDWQYLVEEDIPNELYGENDKIKEAYEECRRIAAMQHAVCDARGGKHKWLVPKEWPHDA